MHGAMLSILVLLYICIHILYMLETAPIIWIYSVQVQFIDLQRVRKSSASLVQKRASRHSETHTYMYCKSDVHCKENPNHFWEHGVPRSKAKETRSRHTWHMTRTTSWSRTLKAAGYDKRSFNSAFSSVWWELLALLTDCFLTKAPSKLNRFRKFPFSLAFSTVLVWTNSEN